MNGLGEFSKGFYRWWDRTNCE